MSQRVQDSSTFKLLPPWINARAIELRSAGYLTQVQFDGETRASIRLRVESASWVGEILIWDTLLCDEYVASLESGEFVHEVYGKMIEVNSISHQLHSFLSFFPTPANADL
jgi:hypothetical protein